MTKQELIDHIRVCRARAAAVLPASRELSLVLTKLADEAELWLGRAPEAAPRKGG